MTVSTTRNAASEEGPWQRCPWPPFADATMLPLLVRLLPPSTVAMTILPVPPEVPPETTAWTMPEAALVKLEPPSTKTEVRLWVPPEFIAAMVPLLVALPSAKTKPKAKFSKPPELTALNEPLLVKVSVSTITNALLRNAT